MQTDWSYTGVALNQMMKFFMSRDGLIAVAGLVLLGSVVHFNTENPGVNFIARVGNLALFLYIIYRAAGAQIVALFVGRRAAIAQELEMLRQKKLEAEQGLADLQQRIANLDAEQETILAESRKQAEVLKAAILERAEKQAMTIREQAERSAGSQARQELMALRAEMADHIAAAVEKALQERLTPESHAKLVDNSLKKVVLH